jgi:hypothetical protein
MNIIPFTPESAHMRSWSSHELETLLSIYETYAAKNNASSWDVGATERDDPQFYILGPPPDLECIVVISRVDRIYLFENGSGQVLHEGTSLGVLSARAKALADQKPLSLVARITLSLTAIRLTIEEKLEPILVESEEVLLRVTPQLAALI